MAVAVAVGEAVGVDLSAALDWFAAVDELLGLADVAPGLGDAVGDGELVELLGEGEGLGLGVVAGFGDGE